MTLPTIPDDDADFTPDLARKIIAIYQKLLVDVKSTQAQNKPIELPSREIIARIINPINWSFKDRDSCIEKNIVIQLDVDKTLTIADTILALISSQQPQELSEPVACEKCSGDGYINIHENVADVKCKTCNGSGIVTDLARGADNAVLREETSTIFDWLDELAKISEPFGYVSDNKKLRIFLQYARTHYPAALTKAGG